jgi:hypothetical protein
LVAIQLAATTPDLVGVAILLEPPLVFRELSWPEMDRLVEDDARPSPRDYLLWVDDTIRPPRRSSSGCSTVSVMPVCPLPTTCRPMSTITCVSTPSWSMT